MSNCIHVNTYIRKYAVLSIPVLSISLIRRVFLSPRINSLFVSIDIELVRILTDIAIVYPPNCFFLIINVLWLAIDEQGVSFSIHISSYGSFIKLNKTMEVVI